MFYAKKNRLLIRPIVFSLLFVLLLGTTSFAAGTDSAIIENENTVASVNEDVSDNSDEEMIGNPVQQKDNEIAFSSEEVILPEESDKALSPDVVIPSEESDEALSPESSLSLQETERIVIEYGKKYEGDLSGDNENAYFLIPVSESGRFFLHDTSFDGEVLPKMDFEFVYSPFQDTYKDYKPSPGIKYMHLTIYALTADQYGHFSFYIDFASAKESFPCDHVNESGYHQIELDHIYYGQLAYGGTTYETAYTNNYAFDMPSDGAVNIEVTQWDQKNNYGIETKRYKFNYRIVQGYNGTRWSSQGIDIKDRAVLKKGHYRLCVTANDESMTGNYKLKISTKPLPAPVKFTFQDSYGNMLEDKDLLSFPLLYYWSYDDTTDIYQENRLFGALHYADGSLLYLQSSYDRENYWLHPMFDKMAAKWKSSDKSVVTVDQTGLIQAVGYGKAKITITALEDSACKAVLPVDVKFSDVYDSSKYYYKPVCWAADHDYINGSYRAFTYGKPAAINFYPNRSCTRLQFITILWKMAGTPAADKSVLKKFTDISDKDTGSSAVAWGVQNGIIFGYKDKTFKPGKAISRKEALLMIYRFAGEPKVSGRMQFKDVTYPKTSDSYKAVLWGVNNKITNGKTADTFAPNDKCVRGQIATFLYRYKRLK